MLRITFLFLFLFFQSGTLFSQVKMKTVDLLVDSFLVKNKLKKIPNDMFVQVQFYKIKELKAVAIQVTVAEWKDIENTIDHYELHKLYKYNLMNGQSVLFKESAGSQLGINSFLVKGRLRPTDSTFLEEVRLRSSSTKKRTDIFKLDYVYFLTPEHFQWIKIRDFDKEVEAVKAAEEMVEE